MRFIVFVIDDTTGSASGDEMHSIDEFNDRLRADGRWVMAAGIAAPDQARVIDGREGREAVRPGSLFEDGEYYSGFWIIEAENREVAERLALAGSRACNRRVEVRPFLGS